MANLYRYCLEELHILPSIFKKLNKADKQIIEGCFLAKYSKEKSINLLEKI